MILDESSMVDQQANLESTNLRENQWSTAALFYTARRDNEHAALFLCPRAPKFDGAAESDHRGLLVLLHF